MFKTKGKFKFIVLLVYILTVFVTNSIYAETVSTSYKETYEKAYIYVGDLELTDIIYKENSNKTVQISGNAKNSGSSFMGYVVKATCYTSNYEIITSISGMEFLEKGEQATFNLEISETNLKSGYTLSDIAMYKISVEPSSQETENDNTKEEINLTGYNFVIDNYKIDMIVNENNTYEITEVLNVTFNKSQHGIYRNIPLTNDVIRTDGTSNKNRVQIKDIYVSENYTTSRLNGNLQIKIGDANRYVSGKKQYVIKYVYNIGTDKLDNADELYFNLIGTEWETAIRNVEFSIQMPKDFDESLVGFSSGTLGSVDNSDVEYTVDGTKITGTYNDILMPGEALTVRITLPEGYYVGAGLENDIFSIVAIAVAVLCALLAYVLWSKHGKDDPVVETVEFYPPDNAGPLDIGFMYKGYVDTKDVVSLLIHLANKGYIKIEENRGKSLFSSGNFTIIKLKDYDGTNDAEKIFMRGLFKKRVKFNGIGSVFSAIKGEDVDVVKETNENVVTASDLQYDFYVTLDRIKSMMNTKKNKNKIFESTASGIGKWLILMAILVYSAITIPLVVTYSPIGPMAIIFAMLFPIIGESILVTMVFTKSEKVVYVNGVPTTSRVVSILFGLMFGVFFGGMPWCMIVLPCIFAEPSWIPAYIIGIIAIIIILVFNNIMSKRTKFGTEMLGRIRGFKRFLENAEKVELESMVAKNPEYFYDILPYAYVLDVSDKWIKQFETIAVMPPNWYAGTGPFTMATFGGFMHSTMSSATSAMNSRPSSGGSGGGGGFSGGGGGSSGGGSGGGGGGSW